jgi:hypothetical protein
MATPDETVMDLMKGKRLGGEEQLLFTTCAAQLDAGPMFPIWVIWALATVSLKVAGVETPLTLAVAVRAPVAVAVATTEASPFEPVTTGLLENVRPEPLKVTTAPGTSRPLESCT